ncbi:MAG: hypothetical protein LBS26_01130 [Campylobacteraceae bacterium]|jgi:hypothetical protein|nr:hypothetical protein [Campylobacteraceae bacterium]
MSNKKERLLPKQQRQIIKTTVKNKNTAVLSNKIETVLFCGAVIICAFALVAYFTFMK